MEGEEKQYFSILDVDLNDHERLQNIEGSLNSPRTIEAMETLGLNGSELKPIQRSDVYEYLVKRERKKDIPKEIINIRWETLNERRFKK